MVVSHQSPETPAEVCSSGHGRCWGWDGTGTKREPPAVVASPHQFAARSWGWQGAVADFVGWLRLASTKNAAPTPFQKGTEDQTSKAQSLGLILQTWVETGGRPRATCLSGWGPAPLRRWDCSHNLQGAQEPQSCAHSWLCQAAYITPLLLQVGGTGVLGINSLVLRTLKLQKEQNEKS